MTAHRVAHPYGSSRPAGRCYRAPPCGPPCSSSSSRSACGWRSLPRSPIPRTRIRSTTWTSRGPWPPATASPWTSCGSSPRSAGSSRRTRCCRSPATGTGCRLPRWSRSRSSGCWARPRSRPPCRSRSAASLAAPIARAIAREVGATRRIALGAGILVAIPALATPFMAQPDNFGLYEPLVAAALWMAARGLKGHPRSYALAGLLVGVATLARNDGVLVGRRRRPRVRLGSLARLAEPAAPGRRRSRPGPRSPAPALFLVVVAPWLARQLAVFGTLSPSTGFRARCCSSATSASGTASRRRPPSITSLARAIGPLIASRVTGCWRRSRSSRCSSAGSCWRRSWSSAPGVDGGRGTSARSWPTPRSCSPSPALDLRGPRAGRDVHPLGDRAGAARLRAGPRGRRGRGRVGRRPAPDAGMRRPPARFFTAAAVGFAVIAGVLGSVATHATGPSRSDDPGRWPRRSTPPARRSRTGSCPSTRRGRATGRAAAAWSWSNDPLDTVEQVARAYEIRWLVVNRADSVSAAAPLLAGTAAGLGRRPDPRGGRRSDASSDLAVFPVCTHADDTRCAGGGPVSRVRREPPRGLAERRARLRRRTAGPGLGGCADAVPDPRGRHLLLGRARATWSTGHGLISNALWSYVTPARDASGGLSLGFPRPAFEIWLPLPTLLAAIPMARDRRPTSYGAALLVPVLPGR